MRRDPVALDDPKDDRADEGKREIGGHHAELADESHGRSPWLLTSLGEPTRTAYGCSSRTGQRPFSSIVSAGREPAFAG